MEYNQDGVLLHPIQNDEASESANESQDYEGLERRRILASRAYQQGTQYVSMDLILSNLGMSQYTDFFIRAGEDMVEAHAMREDEDVDFVLNAVERANDMKFPASHRFILWKTLRYRYFKSPENAKPFIGKHELPLIILPKKDFKARDDLIDVKLLDSERQRMIARKVVFDEMSGATVIQEEVYKRQSHISLELAGLEKTMKFWLSQDPRKMAREDPREEVLLNQTKAIEIAAAGRIDKLKIEQRTKVVIHRAFLVLKFLFLSLSVLFVVIGILDAGSGTSGLPPTERFLTTSYVRCSVIYFMTFWCLLEVTKKRQSFTYLDEAKRLHAKCRLMYSDMIAFRLKTHYVRQEKIARYLDEANIVDVGPAKPSPQAKPDSIPGGSFKNYVETQESGKVSPSFVSIAIPPSILAETQSVSKVALPLDSDFGKTIPDTDEIRSIIHSADDLQELDDDEEHDQDGLDAANLEFQLMNNTSD